MQKLLLAFIFCLSSSLWAQSECETKSAFENFSSKYNVTFVKGTEACSKEAALLVKAFALIEAVATPELWDRHQFAGIVVTGEAHPLAAMRFNLETRNIEIFDQGFVRGPELLASALVHEARHGIAHTHAICPHKPFMGLEACDENLPELSQWETGGSYVYELAFQRRAIDLKIDGYEKYIKFFIGNVHIRFASPSSLEAIDQWLGPELLEREKTFIQYVRRIYRAEPSKK